MMTDEEDDEINHQHMITHVASEGPWARGITKEQEHQLRAVNIFVIYGSLARIVPLSAATDSAFFD